MFAFLADASNNPTWQKGMRSCGWNSAGPIAVGSTYDSSVAADYRRLRDHFSAR